MRIYLLILIAALGLVALACGESGPRPDLLQVEEEPSSGAITPQETESLSAIDCVRQGSASAGGLRPQQPLIFCGRVIAEGEVVPDGTIVEAQVRGETCGTAVTSDGLYWLDLPLFGCAEASTSELTFLVDGQPAKTVTVFARVNYVNLIVGQAP